jgi:WD40 repeat protein/dienelactone hydrolase
MEEGRRSLENLTMVRTRLTVAGVGLATVLLVLALGAGGGAAAAETTAYIAKPGPYAVEAASYDWFDKTRDREVPVKIYFPKTRKGPFPVIIFSHGLGGSRDGYEYLGRHWASYGYVSVHLQHKGSDTDVWKGQARPLDAMRQAIKDPRNSINRPLDVRFAIDQMEKMNRDPGLLRGRLDLRRIGMAGHSFGAWTTLAVIGEVFVGPGGREITLADPRIKAAIAMSAPVPRDKTKLDQAFGKIKIPCLHMTGTLDDSPIGDTVAKDRRLPYDHIRGADQYLVIFAGGDHMIFSGRGRLAGGGKDAVFQALIRPLTTVFWDAYLKDDPQAKAFLAHGGPEKLLGKEGTAEKKLAARLVPAVNTLPTTSIRALTRERPAGSVVDMRFSADGQSFIVNIDHTRVVKCDTTTGTVRCSQRVCSEKPDYMFPGQSPQLMLAADANTWAILYPLGQIEFGQLQPPKRWDAEFPAFPAGYGPIIAYLPPGAGWPDVFKSDTSPEMIVLSDNAAVLAASYTEGRGKDWVVLWDASSGKILHSLKDQHDVLRVCLPPDGKTMAIERRCHREPEPFAIELWDVATGRQHGRPLATYYGGPVCSLLFADNDRLIWLSDGNGICAPHVTSICLSTGRQRQFEIPSGPFTSSFHLKLLASPRVVVLANENGQVQALDAATLAPRGKPRSLWDKRDNSFVVRCLACSPDGVQLAASKDGTDHNPAVRIFNVETGARRDMTLHTTNRATLSPPGR